MRFFKLIDNAYIVAVGKGCGGQEITEDEYAKILEAICTKPTVVSGFYYRLKSDLKWELVELPQIEEQPTGYTEEQLSEMTNAELSVILADMGISGSMTKANMITLILDKQSQV